MSHPRRARILVVDDHQGSRELLGRHLRPTYDVLTAETGKSALQDLRNHQIDLVIQDVGLADMDGLTLLQESKTLQPQLPVIMITGRGTVASARAAMNLGAVAFLLKPFNLEELRLLVEDVCRTIGLC